MAAVSHETISPKAEWWSRAACRSADPELFFPVSAAGPSRAETAAAKAVCAACDVRRECLAFACDPPAPRGMGRNQPRGTPGTAHGCRAAGLGSA